MCMQSELMQMSYRDPNSKDESSPSGLSRWEEIKKESNDEDKTEQSRPVGHSRRDFIVSAATAVASVGAANLLGLQPAEGANARIQMRLEMARIPLKVWRPILRLVPTSS